MNNYNIKKPSSLKLLSNMLITSTMDFLTIRHEKIVVRHKLDHFINFGKSFDVNWENNPFLA